MSTNFRATHKITFTATDGERTTFDVMLHDEGAAYSREEWEQAANASWSCDPDSGEWLCEGQVTPGGANGTVEVVEIDRETAATTTPTDTPRTFHDIATWRRLGSESETEDRDGGFAARGSDLTRDEIAADLAAYHAGDLDRCADDAARAEALEALVGGYMGRQP